MEQTTEFLKPLKYENYLGLSVLGSRIVPHKTLAGSVEPLRYASSPLTELANRDRGNWVASYRTDLPGGVGSLAAGGGGNSVEIATIKSRLWSRLSLSVRLSVLSRFLSP